MERTCTRCGESKPLSQFPSNGGGRIRSDCRRCHAECMTRRRRNETPEQRERRLAQARRYQRGKS